jgi:hypothetical protein
MEITEFFTQLLLYTSANVGSMFVLYRFGRKDFKKFLRGN